MTAEIADAAQRAKALDTGRSFIVQAPAGSGKTSLLTQRFLALLCRVESPEEIVAITFTRKAAGEMRNRIIEALVSAAGDAPEKEYEQAVWQLGREVLEQDRRKQWGLIANPNRLRVQTIDSLCAGLGRRMPVLSSFGGQPQISDEADHLYRMAARRTLLQLGDSATGQALGVLLSDLDNNIGQLERLLAGMLQNRDQWLRLIMQHDRQGMRESLEQGLHMLVRSELQALAATLPCAILERMVELAGFAAAHLPEKNSGAPVSVWRDRRALPTADPEDLQAWRGLANLALTNSGPGLRKRITVNEGFPPAEREKKAAMQALLDDLGEDEAAVAKLDVVRHLPEPRYSEEQWTRLESLQEVLVHAVLELLLVFAERGEVDHVEVMQRALQALGEEDEPTDLALMMDYRIRHLLVDEFQDTSHGQYRLLRKLTAGWEPGDGRTLFCVGDPMQSIYRFREADVGLYLQARQAGIGDLRLEPLNLCVNFRSSATIIDWVNRTFSATFPELEQPVSGAVTYASSVAHHPQGASNSILFHPMLDEDREQEASVVCELVRQTLADYPEEKIAILTRAKSHLADILPALRKAGIPYQAVDIESLAHHQVVRDLMALTRALLHPADRIAWLSVLRAPWCGLDNADLLAIARAAGDQPLRRLFSGRESIEGLSEEGHLRFARIADTLQEPLREARRQPLAKLVESTWLALGGPALLQQSVELEAAERFLETLSVQETGSDLEDFAALEEALEKLFAPPDPESGGKVQVMTMHKAKGLEFDTVILPGLGRIPRNDTEQLLNWSYFPDEQGNEQLVMAPIRETGADREAIQSYIRLLERTKQQHEDLRLLYVAATRARKRLHMCGSARITANSDTPKPSAHSLLARLWPAVGHEFDRLAEHDRQMQAETEGEEDTREIPSLRRVPSGWQPQAPAAISWPQQLTPVEREVAPEFLWAGTTARHVGTVVHRYLEWIANSGIDDWNAERITAYRDRITSALQALGVTHHLLPDATEKVVLGLRDSLEDSRGRWILSNHVGARCEYALTARTPGGLRRLVIDRTFIDEDETRWIIDYKTGIHQGGNLDGFLAQEAERYSAQLGAYRDALGQLEEREIRIALYFPLMKAWKELEMTSA
jgi:ATP-dependent exoDNAse (exonuclease V) beta subunit